MTRLAALLLLCAFVLTAQTAPPANFAAAGVSYGAGPAGTAIYAKSVDSVGTYSCTVMDAVPTSTKPLTVSSQVMTGACQKLISIGKVSLYVPAAAGMSWNGGNAGWGWTTGGMAVIPVKTKYSINPAVRVVKSSVSNNSGYQLIGTVTFGWNW